MDEHIEEIVDHPHQGHVAHTVGPAGQILALGGVDDLNVSRFAFQLYTHIGDLVVEKPVLMPIQTGLVVLAPM